MVDEHQPEIHTDRYGKVKSYGQSKPNLRYLEKGDKIYSNPEAFFQEHKKKHIEEFVWNMNAISNGDAISRDTMDQALITTITGMRDDMDRMGRRIEKIAKRPIQNKVTVEIEDNRHY